MIWLNLNASKPQFSKGAKRKIIRSHCTGIIISAIISAAKNWYTYINWHDSRSQDYYKDGGYVCPSDIFYGRPKRAINTYGKWKVVVNLPDEYYAKGYGKGYEKYTQTARLEQCMWVLRDLK